MTILFEKLKSIVEDRRRAGTPDQAIINALKEELQYVVLEFLYHDKTYSHLIMYGGTLLRIAYGLPRMSEDLDFQTDQKLDFNVLKERLIGHFKREYGVDVSIRMKTQRQTSTDLGIIDFRDILPSIGFRGHGLPTVLKVRFDMNRFEGASAFATETIPIVKSGYAFSLRTYPISTLMASKIGAVLWRPERGIGMGMSPCKPRDIFDLMWYLEQKIIPNLDYLKARSSRPQENLELESLLDVFDLLRKKVGNLSDDFFAHDLSPFFYNPAEFDHWFGNWRQKCLILLDAYPFFQIKKTNGNPELKDIYFAKDFISENRTLHFFFLTEAPSPGTVKFTVVLGKNWFIHTDLHIPPGQRRNDIEHYIPQDVIRTQKLDDLDYEYIGLFYTKIHDYIKRHHFGLLQKELKTKIIRASAENLDVKTEIILNPRLLLKAKFEDLL